MLDLFKNLFSQSDNSQLAAIIKDNAFLVDVRSSGEFSSGSVKGAVNIPLDKISSQLAKFKGKKNIVVFCASGNRSGQAQRVLEQNGIKNVTNGGSWRSVYQIVNQK